MFDTKDTAEFSLAVEAAVPACAAMVVVSLAVFFGTALWTSTDAGVRANEGGEVMMVIVGLGGMMTVWSVSVIAIVLWPLMRALHAITHGESRPWLFGAAGVGALPFAVLAFTAVSKVIPGNARPFAEQLSFMVQDPLNFAPILLGFCGGGLVFGIIFGRNHRHS